jgi:DNA repair protein RadA/Sms
VLLGGEPASIDAGFNRYAALQARGVDVLYASAEESVQQVRLRGERLGIHEEHLLVLAETGVSRVLAEAEARPPAVLVIDSIQAVQQPDLSSTPGTVSQVRAAAGGDAVRQASRGPVLLVGHVTKDGSLAGPKSFRAPRGRGRLDRGDRNSGRLLRVTKNRFGPVDEIALG